MYRSVYRVTVLFLVVCLLFSLPLFPQALETIPLPGKCLTLSDNYSFALLRGVTFDPKHPMNLEFMVDTANAKTLNALEADTLISYFFAGLTLSDNELWVNLSPHEKNRIAPDGLSATALGRDMLSQDYVLKQLAASLTYPESQIGKTYWQTINSTNSKDSKNSLRKVWIVPDKAVIYENKNSAVILKATLNTLTERDYLSNSTNSMDSFKKHILPQVNEQVNRGRHFAQLRQIYHSLVLAVWFKQKFKESFYKQYINSHRLSGIELKDKNIREEIYKQYLEAYKKGVYDFVKYKHTDSSKIIRQRYFSGGAAFVKIAKRMQVVGSAAQVDELVQMGTVLAVANGYPVSVVAKTVSTGPVKLVSGVTTKIDDVSMDKLLEEVGAYNRKPSDEDVDKVLAYVERLASRVVLRSLQLKIDFGRHSGQAEYLRAELMHFLEDQPIRAAVNFLKVLDVYFDEEIPDNDLFQGLDHLMISYMPVYVGRFDLLTKSAVNQFGEYLKDRIAVVEERTGKKPVVVEVAAGYGDLTFGLKRLLPGVKIIPTDGFYFAGAAEGERVYDEDIIRRRGVKKLDTADIVDNSFRAKLGISADTPVIIIGDHLPREGDVERNLYEQHNVDDIILVVPSESGTGRKIAGELGLEANDDVWNVRGIKLSSDIWHTCALGVYGKTALELQLISRHPGAPLDQPGYHVKDVVIPDAHQLYGRFGRPGNADFFSRVMEQADRMSRKTLGQLADSRKKPSVYHFALRKVDKDKLIYWNDLAKMPSVEADNFLNLLTDYIGSGMPRVEMLVDIYRKLSSKLTDDQAREFLEILDRHVTYKGHYKTIATNKMTKMVFEDILRRDYPALFDEPQAPVKRIGGIDMEKNRFTLEVKGQGDDTAVDTDGGESYDGLVFKITRIDDLSVN